MAKQKAGRRDEAPTRLETGQETPRDLTEAQLEAVAGGGFAGGVQVAAGDVNGVLMISKQQSLRDRTH
jgi:hypothetical protein